MASKPGPVFTGIDTHAHVFRHDLPMVAGRRYSPAYDAEPQAYLAKLDEHGLSHGVLIQPSFLGTDNSYMLAALRAHAARLKGVAVVAPDVAEAELDELAAAGVVGIRLNLVGQDLDMYLQPVWQDCLARIARRGWQIEIQRGIDDLARALPVLLQAGAPVVVDHFGLPHGGLDASQPAHEAFLRLLQDAPVWVKLSAGYRSTLTPEQEAHAYATLRQACGGVDRFVWGSDWPNTQFEQQVGYGSQWQRLQALVTDDAERQRILVDNPRRLFGFDPA